MRGGLVTDISVFIKRMFTAYVYCARISLSADGAANESNLWSAILRFAWLKNIRKSYKVIFLGELFTSFLTKGSHIWNQRVILNDTLTSNISSTFHMMLFFLV